MIQDEVVLQGEIVAAEAPPQPMQGEVVLQGELVAEAPPQAPVYAQPPQPVYSQPAPVAMPPAAPQTVQVQIPAGMRSNQVFNVQANGQMIPVTVPVGCRPGGLLTVQVPPAVTVQQPVVQQPGQTIVVQQGGGRAHKYDASVLSGAWMMDNEACPGCCPRQMNIMAMGQDAFQLGQSPMFTRDGGTDNFRSAGSPGRGPCMALVLSENDIKLAAAGGNENFKLTKIKRTNLVDRAQTVQVQIPAGMMPGSVFDVQANGQRIRVTVPAGGKAGQLLNVRVPQQRPIGR
ncbi:unnamed protein product [Pelagomonas calceolata]|uniref:Uncharacterized protein n=2 Tax=Pelagomonas calceolata TaxID=35677 RepID=A0A8J2S5L9_9STRA|nr:unnamed protein product [Pelagomonas calceolata]